MHFNEMITKLYQILFTLYYESPSKNIKQQRVNETNRPGGLLEGVAIISDLIPLAQMETWNDISATLG